MNRGFTFSWSLCLSLLFLVAGCKKKEELIPTEELAISSYYPNSGKGGTLVTVEGSGFGNDRAAISVNFGSTAAEVLSATGSKVIVRVPEGENAVQITLSGRGKSIDVGQFTYQALSVQEVRPTRAQVGAQIRVIGSGFSSVAGTPKVLLNDVEANVINAFDTLLVVEVPEGSGQGPVEVTVDDMEAAGPDFLYMNIEAMKPLTGGVGTRVVISGEGFMDGIAGNVVAFNGKEAEVVEASEAQVVVIAPEGVESGPVLLTVDGEPVQGPEFTVVPFPGIETVSPLSGPGGVEMIIEGTTFSPEEGETHVFINGVEVELTSVTPTLIKLIIPGGTGSGKVVVEVNDQATEGPVFRDQNLGIVSLTPDNGLAGTEVLIAGTGFSTVASENQVLFNGIAATVLEATANSLKVRTPEGVSTGRIHVTVDGLNADSPIDFKRAGVVSLGQGQLNIAADGGGIAVDKQGNVYVLEYPNNRVMKVTPEGQVSLFAGSPSGAEGMADGAGSAARFRLNKYAGIAIDDQQHIYVTDPGNRAMRRISLSGEVVTLVANFGGEPAKIAMKPNGDMYVTSVAGYPMWFVSPANNMYQSFAGTQHAAGAANIRHAVDAANNIYTLIFFDSPNTIAKSWQAPSGLWERNYFWAGGFFTTGYQDGVGESAMFNGIRAIVPENADHLLVLDANNYALRRIHIPSATVSTLVKLDAGFEDGDFRTAKFSNATWDLTVSADGSAIYVLDCGNNAVRKVMLR